MLKRGQFFLIAAIIITGIAFSLAAVYTSTRVQKEDTQFYDLSTEIGFEGTKVLENGIYTKANINELIKTLTDIYAKSISDSNSTLIFIYGDKDSLTQLTYLTESQGSVNIGAGTTPLGESIYKTSIITSPATIEGNKVKVKLADQDYMFDIKEGENFFMVIQKERLDERVVIAK